MSTTGWIMAGVAAIIFARWGYLRLLARADRERAAVYGPFDEMLHEQDSAKETDDGLDNGGIDTDPEVGDDTLAMLRGMSEEDWREHLRLSDDIDRAQAALNAHVARVEAKGIETTWADLHDLPVSEWPGVES